MSTINERIGEIIDNLHITKTAFAEKLKVSQQYISKLTKTGTPSELLIDDICEKFNINENWLRNGTGKMFSEILPEDETTAIISNLLKNNNNTLYHIIKGIMKTYEQLDSKSKEVLENFSQDLLYNLSEKKNLNQFTIDERVEDYRRQLEAEEKVGEKSSALPKDA